MDRRVIFVSVSACLLFKSGIAWMPHMLKKAPMTFRSADKVRLPSIFRQRILRRMCYSFAEYFSCMIAVSCRASCSYSGSLFHIESAIS